MSSPGYRSVNYALRFPESATSLITPSGQCQAYLPLAEATGLFATRYAPERHRPNLEA